jgi:hypothetical protein
MAASRGKRVLAWCTRCQRLKLAVVEEEPPTVIPIPPALPVPKPDPLRRLAQKVERLRNALGAFGAELVGDAWDRGVRVQYYRIAAEEVVVFLDGHTVDLEGPPDLVRRVVAVAEGKRG